MVRARDSKYWIYYYHGESKRVKTKGTRFETMLLRFQTMLARVKTMLARAETKLALMPW